MDDSVMRLMTHEDYESFAKNVEAKHPGLTRQTLRRAVQLKALSFGAETDSRREALEAVYAAEAALSAKDGKTTRALAHLGIDRTLGLTAGCRLQSEGVGRLRSPVRHGRG